jgi:LmbE family N-acetylglucosaminyl deacetylase/glycosyltransferase involved in cell wall biosynthesis
MSFVEQSIVPYEAGTLAGERLLVIAPHPDDEVIGSGGLMKLHIAEKRSVRVVVVTSGESHAPENGDTTAAPREEETRRGLALLGVSDARFLRLPDRGVEENLAELARFLGEELSTWKPDLVVVPGPLEVHPDHLATARALVSQIQQNHDLAPHLALTRIAFAEISQPLRPNVIVDISAVAEAKYEAIRTHASQLGMRDYEQYARGLASYRAMTLPPGTTAAEGYWVISAAELRTTPWSELERRVSGTAAQLLPAAEHPPVTVLVRTRNRIALLREALSSIARSGYPASVVVVNDGGESPREAVAQSGIARVELIELETSGGRSEAMNHAARAAGAGMLAFLDDDDLHYPEHLPTLATAAARGGARAYYSDAISAFLAPGDDGSWVTRSRMRIFSADYDPELLLVDNYIPLPALLVRRDDFLDCGGFDRSFDLFEDWEFLIRLSRRTPLLHVPRITCEIRHFEGGGSIVLGSPEGSAAFLDAKLAVWRRHADLYTPELFAKVFSRQKGRLRRLTSEAEESTGRAGHLELDVARLEREKTILLEEVREQHGKFVQASTELGASRFELEQSRGEITALRQHATALETLLQQHREAIASKDGLIERMSSDVDVRSAEIERLNGILETIYRSRTWKLHETLEKVRRRS